MFTGLIEHISQIESTTPIECGKRITLDLGHLKDETKLGDSVAINGVCLTICEYQDHLACFDIMQETLNVSSFANCQQGQLVNLELAMKADGRLGGHFVQGHIDGLGEITKIHQTPDEILFWVKCPESLMKLMINKGSVAIDGISLTIVKAEKENFYVSLIPTTWEKTNIKERKIGDLVNIEADLISKWINKRLDDILENSTESSLTMEKLREQGFA